MRTSLPIRVAPISSATRYAVRSETESSAARSAGVRNLFVAPPGTEVKSESTLGMTIRTAP
jgi:hypothetical protein